MRMPYAAELAERETLDGNISGHRSNGSMRGTVGMSGTSQMASMRCEHRSASRSTGDECSDLYATLHAPEQERSLDFSGVFAAIQLERPTASRHTLQAMTLLPDACPAPVSKAMPALARRAVRVSQRLAEIGAKRPMVVIPR